MCRKKALCDDDGSCERTLPDKKGKSIANRKILMTFIRGGSMAIQLRKKMPENARINIYSIAFLLNVKDYFCTPC